MAINKTRFHVKQVDYLGYVTTDKGISVSAAKVRAVKAWKPPAPDATSAVKWAQEFLEFANFYRRFIDQFSKIAKLLSHLQTRIRGMIGPLPVSRHLTLLNLGSVGRQCWCSSYQGDQQSLKQMQVTMH